MVIDSFCPPRKVVLRWRKNCSMDKQKLCLFKTLSALFCDTDIDCHRHELNDQEVARGGNPWSGSGLAGFYVWFWQSGTNSGAHV